MKFTGTRSYVAPDDLKVALDSAPPDVLALSSFAWNHNRSAHFARYAKRRAPSIVTMMGIGIYSLNNSGTDVLLAALFGFVGYVLSKLDCPFPPLILAMVLGPLMEENLRRSLLLTDGDPSVFFTRPISAGFMAVTGALLVVFALPVLRRKRREVLAPDGNG
jgi:TctA family transporter